MNVYKVEWYQPGHGVQQYDVEAKTAEAARNKARRKYGKKIPRGEKLFATRLAVNARLGKYGVLRNPSKKRRR